MATGRINNINTNGVLKDSWWNPMDWPVVGDILETGWEFGGGAVGDLAEDIANGKNPLTSLTDFGKKVAGDPVNTAENLVTDATDAIGLTNSGEVEEAYDNAAQVLAEQQAKADQAYDTAGTYVNTVRGAISDIIGPEGMEKYKQLIYSMAPQDYTTDTTNLKNFSFDRDVSKFLDPNAEYVIDQSVKAAQQAMAGHGGLTGGAAARALQAEASAKASELYGDAFDRMMKATEQEYGKERDVTIAEQTNAQNRLETDKFRADQLGNLSGSYVGNLQGNVEDIIQLMLGKATTDLSVQQALAQLGIDKASLPTETQQLLGMVGDVAGTAANIKKTIA